jgi:hypothetical protein
VALRALIRFGPSAVKLLYDPLRLLKRLLDLCASTLSFLLILADAINQFGGCHVSSVWGTFGNKSRTSRKSP